MATQTAFCATFASLDFSPADGADFSDASNAGADDGSYATFTNAASTREHTPLLVCTMGGNAFAVPAGSRIDGITVEYEGKCSSASGYEERNNFLVVGGYVTGLNRYTDRTLTTSDVAYTNGGATDRFGVSLTVASVNASNFGTALRWERDGTGSSTLSIDYVKITVHYTEAAGDISYDADFAIGIGYGTLHLNHGAGANSQLFKVMIPGFGTPEACFLFGFNENENRAGAAPSFPLTRAAVCHAVGGATSTSVRLTGVNNSVDGAYAAKHGNDDESIFTTQGASNRKYDFSSFGTDYVELIGDGPNAATTSTATWYDVLVIAIRGTGVQCAGYVQGPLNGLTSEENNITTIGFEPNLLILFSAADLDEDLAHSIFLGQEIGLCYNPGTGNGNLVQRKLGYQHRYKDSDGVDLANVECDGVLYTDRIHYFQDIGHETEYWWTVKDFDSQGFTVVGHGGNAVADLDDGGFFLALRIEGRSIAVGDFTTPTSSGSQAMGDSHFDPNIDFTPAAMIMGWSKLQTKDSIVTDSEDSEAWGVSFITASKQANTGICNENAQAAIDANTWLGRSAVGLYDETGAAIFAGEFTSFDDGGLTINFGTADGTARRGIYAAIGEAAEAAGAAHLRRTTMRGGELSMSGGML